MTDFDPPLRLYLMATRWLPIGDTCKGKAGGSAARRSRPMATALARAKWSTRLRDAGCRDFFVAHWGEAAAIADLVPPAQISVLNGIDEGDVARLNNWVPIPVLNTPKQIAIGMQPAAVAAMSCSTAASIGWV